RPAQQGDELAPSHALITPASTPGAFYRTLKLPQSARQVLGPSLNCSEIEAADRGLMSALGQKRTSGDRLGYVRFAPESGHWRVGHRMSALCQKRTLSWACYSITSSAVCWSCRGTSRPSALAVLRLITS